MRPPIWTEQESAIVKELRGQGKEFSEIAEQLPGRTRNAVKRQFYWLMTDEAGRRRARERQNLQRQSDRKDRTRKSGMRPVSEIPLEVFVDRAAREATPKTITQVLMGDPPIGWRALDRREVRT
jgi:hypothetical protein